MGYPVRMPVLSGRNDILRRRLKLVLKDVHEWTSLSGDGVNFRL